MEQYQKEAAAGQKMAAAWKASQVETIKQQARQLAAAQAFAKTIGQSSGPTSGLKKASKQ